MSDRGVNWMTRAAVPGLVSVIVPVHNRERMIGLALDSIRSQTYRPIEIIVVDDGSTDSTVNVVEEWREKADSGLTLHLETSAHAGAPKARNIGLQSCRGEFIQYLDSDDLLVATKIGNQVRALQSDSTVFFAWSKQISAKPAEAANLIHGLASESRFRKMPRSSAPLLVHQGLFRREACESVGAWNEELIKNQDWEYSVRYVALALEGLEASDVGYVWVKHDGPRIGGDWHEKQEKLISSVLMAADSAARVTGENRPKAASEQIAKSYSSAMIVLLSKGDMKRAAMVREKIRMLVPVASNIRVKNEIAFILSRFLGPRIAVYISRR